MGFIGFLKRGANVLFQRWFVKDLEIFILRLKRKVCLPLSKRNSLYNVCAQATPYNKVEKY